jgi:hypothetical protein
MRHCLRFLYEPMQQDHVAGTDAENHPCNPVSVEIAAHLPQSVHKWRTMRPTNGPSELDLLNIFADRAAIGVRKLQKPFPNRYSARGTYIEARRKFFRPINHYANCAKNGTRPQLLFRENCRRATRLGRQLVEFRDERRVPCRRFDTEDLR